MNPEPVDPKLQDFVDVLLNEHDRLYRVTERFRCRICVLKAGRKTSLVSVVCRLKRKRRRGSVLVMFKGNKREMEVMESERKSRKLEKDRLRAQG